MNIAITKSKHYHLAQLENGYTIMMRRELTAYHEHHDFGSRKWTWVISTPDNTDFCKTKKEALKAFQERIDEAIYSFEN